MSNTLASALVPDTASDRAITVLQNRLTALAAFTTDFSEDLVDPTRPVSIPVVAAAGAAQETPTNFETGDTTVGSEKISPVHISKSFHITQAELNSGHKLQTLFDTNLRSIGNAVLDKAFAPITVANFGAAHVAATPADLDADDLKTLWGSLSDADEKNIVLDGAYYAQHLPVNTDQFALNDGAYGFDKFRYCNRFSGAGDYVKGFVCDSAAIGVAGRIPAMTEAVAGQMTHMENILLPDLGLSVQFCMWASTASRATWASFDLCFGAVKVDAARLQIIATA